MQPHDVASHDKSFWLALRAEAFLVPQRESILPLALEATVMLGSTEPQTTRSSLANSGYPLNAEQLVSQPKQWPTGEQNTNTR